MGLLDVEVVPLAMAGEGARKARDQSGGGVIEVQKGSERVERAVVESMRSERRERSERVVMRQSNDLDAFLLRDDLAAELSGGSSKSNILACNFLAFSQIIAEPNRQGEIKLFASLYPAVHCL